MYSYGPPHMAEQKQNDQLAHTYSSYVRIQDVALKTCQRRWTIGKSGERGSGISILAAWHDDDDDDTCRCTYIYLSLHIYIYIYIYKTVWYIYTYVRERKETKKQRRETDFFKHINHTDSFLVLLSTHLKSTTNQTAVAKVLSTF